jgi:hypothetical protein
MNYLEISILFLFICFLVIFYVTNLIYNKCMTEKAKAENFEDEGAKAVRLAQEAAARQIAAANAAKASGEAAAAQQKADAEAQIQRTAARAANKALQSKWDTTRNDKFGKFNEYVNSINNGTNSLKGHLSATMGSHRKAEAADGSQFSHSTPVQLSLLKGKLTEFYGFNKGRDGAILDITNRMTKVNNILSQAEAGGKLTG